MKIVSAALAALIVAAGTSTAIADPIEGTWLRQSSGTLMEYAKNGSKFCGTILNGDYQGESIGCLENTGDGYKGEVIAVDEGKTYRGKASIMGNVLTLSGCIAGGLLCRGEDWQRQ